MVEMMMTVGWLELFCRWRVVEMEGLSESLYSR